MGMLDDDGLKNAYLTKLRVKIKADSDVMRELTEDLMNFASSVDRGLPVMLATWTP